MPVGVGWVGLGVDVSLLVCGWWGPHRWGGCWKRLARCRVHVQHLWRLPVCVSLVGGVGGGRVGVGVCACLCVLLVWVVCVGVVGCL